MTINSARSVTTPGMVSVAAEPVDSSQAPLLSRQPSLSSVRRELSSLDNEVDLSFDDEIVSAVSKTSSKTSISLNVGRCNGPQNTSIQSSNRTLWTAFWLRTPILLLIAILFCACLAALLLLWHLSAIMSGFQISTGTSHYAYSYGPTAFMVLIVSLWRQVDYYCRTLAPWAALSGQPSDSKKAILLDFVSPLQPVAFWKSFRAGCLAVTATISISALLQLIVR
jgi:hypothetical protein